MKKPLTPQRVIGYLRVSDENCTRTSIDDQKPVVDAYAVTRPGGEIVKYYIAHSPGLYGHIKSLRGRR